MNHNIKTEKIIKELKQSIYPIFIWGAGSMSIEIEQYLKANEIPYGGKFINQNISQSHIVDLKEKIYTIDELGKKYARINVIVGHGHYEKKDDLKAYSFVNEVFIVPNPYPQYKGPDEYFVKDNQEKITAVRNCLEDDISIEAFDSYINFSLTNELDYLLRIRNCVGDIFLYEDLHINDHENFVDVGAWEGDTLAGFLKKANGCYDNIYAVEPEPKSFEILSKQFNNEKNIKLYQVGLGKQSGFFYMNNKNTQSSHVIEEKEEKTEELIKIEVKTLDALFFEKRISILKIFVPFMFFDILKGGEKVIRANKPRLIVNVAADNKSNIFDTILWIKNLELDYKIALRYDFPMPTRLFLYAY